MNNRSYKNKSHLKLVYSEEDNETPNHPSSKNLHQKSLAKYIKTILEYLEIS